MNKAWIGWSVVVVALYAVLRVSMQLKPGWDLALYAVMGVTWTFHMIWTLWMIPRDQPDLKENGTFLSLVIIYLANQVVLAVLLCAVAKPLGFEEFGNQWVGNAAKSWDGFVRMVREVRFGG